MVGLIVGLALGGGLSDKSLPLVRITRASPSFCSSLERMAIFASLALYMFLCLFTQLRSKVAMALPTRLVVSAETPLISEMILPR